MATKVGGVTVEPLRRFRYEVYGGVWLPRGTVGFSEVSGLNTGSTSEEEYADGNDVNIRKLPGRTKYGDVTLKKGCDLGDYLNRWRTATNEALIDAPGFQTLVRPDTLPNGARNTDFRCTLYIELYDRNVAPGVSAAPLKKWMLEGAWLKELNFDPLSGADGGILYETATLSVERIVVVTPAPAGPPGGGITLA